MGVCISKGNSKLGEIKSVSLPSGLTCIKCGCNKKCYAKKIERLRPNVRNSYIRNLNILEEDPQTYWREVEAAIMTSRFFRFHVSGDIPDWDYLIKMVSIAVRNLHCEILCFTKKYEIVNNYLSNVGDLPPNLHMIFSAWVDLKMVNPFHLPEAHVLYPSTISEMTCINRNTIVAYKSGVTKPSFGNYLILLELSKTV